MLAAAVADGIFVRPFGTYSTSSFFALNCYLIVQLYIVPQSRPTCCISFEVELLAKKAHRTYSTTIQSSIYSGIKRSDRRNPRGMYVLIVAYSRSRAGRLMYFTAVVIVRVLIMSCHPVVLVQCLFYSSIVPVFGDKVTRCTRFDPFLPI